MQNSKIYLLGGFMRKMKDLEFLSYLSLQKDFLGQGLFEENRARRRRELVDHEPYPFSQRPIYRQKCEYLDQLNQYFLFQFIWYLILNTLFLQCICQEYINYVLIFTINYVPNVSLITQKKGFFPFLSFLWHLRFIIYILTN